MTTSPGDAAPLLVDTQGAVRVLTLNRPAALNSFTGAMHVALRLALEEAAADANVRALVITGSGRAFCAGDDMTGRRPARASLHP